MTVAIRKRVAIEPSPSYNPEKLLIPPAHSTSSAWELKDNETRATILTAIPTNASNSSRPVRYPYLQLVEMAVGPVTGACSMQLVGMVALISLSLSSHAMDVLCAGINPQYQQHAYALQGYRKGTVRSLPVLV